MALDRGGAGNRNRRRRPITPKKKHEQIRSAPRPQASGRGHVKNLKHFGRIIEKQQKGESINWQDLRYLQRLAWTTKSDKNSVQYNRAIDVSRQFVDELGDKRRVVMKDAQGQPVKVGAFGMDYKKFHEDNKVVNNPAYQQYLDSFDARGREILLGFFGTRQKDAAGSTLAQSPIETVGKQLQNDYIDSAVARATQQADLPPASLPEPGSGATNDSTQPQVDSPDSAPLAPLNLPLSLDDQQARDVAQGHYESQGTLPGPQKLDDLLRSALSWTDLDPSGKTKGKDAWKTFFDAMQNGSAPVAAPLENDIAVHSDIADLMFKENKMPEDGDTAPYYLSAIGRGGPRPKDMRTAARPDSEPSLLAAADKYIGDVHPVEKSYIPRSPDYLRRLQGTVRNNVQKAIQERGFTAGNGMLEYASLVDQFVYSSNLPFAAWGKDEKARGNAMWAMGQTKLVVGKENGQPVNINVLASAMGGRDSEDFKNYVFQLGKQGRPPNVSEANYVYWYARQFGSDKLPYELQPTAELQADGKAVNGPWEATTDVGYAALKLIGVAEPLSTVISDYLAPPVRKVGGAFKTADRAMSRNRVVGEYFWNPTKGGVTGVVDATVKASNYPIELVNQVVVARAYLAMTLNDPDYKMGGKVGVGKGVLMNLGVSDFLAIKGLFDNGWDATAEQAAKAWHASDKRKIWHETLRASGVDPVQHEHIAFWGQMAVDTGIGIVLDKGLGAAVKFAGTTKTADAILDGWNVRSHLEILSEMKSPTAIKQFYGIGDDAATQLAKTVDPTQVDDLIKTHPELAAEFDPAFNFNARSITQNLQIRALRNTKLAPALRFMLAPLPADIYSTVQDTEQQVAATLRILGLPEDEVLKVADDIIADRIATADFPAQAVRNRLAHPDHGVDAIIKRHLSGQDASASFRRKSGNAAATKFDEFEAFVRKYRNMEPDVDRPTPRRAYNAADDANASGYVENSVALGTAQGRALAKRAGKLTNRVSRVERLIDKLTNSQTQLTQEGLDLIGEPLPKAPAHGTLGGQVYRTTARVRRIAADNGITVTGKMTQADVVSALRVMRRRSAAEQRRLATLQNGLADLRTQHQGVIGELNAINPSHGGVPTAANEAHFTNVFVPQYTPTELALFRGGKAMQNWAIIQKRLHMDDVNSAFKRMWLSRIGSMISIVASDEAMRSALQGINPLGGIKGLENVPGFRGSYTERAARVVAGDPRIRVDIESDVLNMPHLNSWDVVGPNGENPRAWEMGARYVVKTMGKDNNLATQVWVDAYDAALGDLNIKHKKLKNADPSHVIPADDVLRQEAMAHADDVFHDTIRTDVRFVGGVDPATGKNYIGILPQRDDVAFNQSLLDQGLDNEPWVQHYEDNTINGLRLMMSHDATEQMLRKGTVAKGDFADATVRNIIGPVQYRVVTRTGGSRILHAPVSFSDGVFNILSGMATHLKKQNFGYYFEKRMKGLDGIAGLSEAQKVDIAKRWALAKTDELSYLSGRTLFEENIRNIVMFLPAYRQFWEWWGKRLITKPFSTSKIMEAMAALQPQRIPQGVPIIGGVEMDPASVNFFSGFQQDEAGKTKGSWLPPLAAAVTVPFGTAGLLGSDEALGIYKAMNSGFEPGGPEVRWADSLLTGVASYTLGRNVDPFYESTKWLLGDKMTGTRYLVEKRDKIIGANLIMLAAATGGKPELLAKLDPKQAVKMMAAQEVGKGTLQFLLPGTWRTTRPVFTVMDDGKPMKIDTQRIAQAQTAYLNAISDAQRAAVIKQFPEYAPIAEAWTYDGNRQLAYLANHRWVVPFVSRKNATKDAYMGIDPANAAEFENQTTPLTPAGILAAIKDRYAEVDRFVLARDYRNVSAGWKEQFLAEGRKKGWKVSEQAWKTYTSEDWDKWADFIERKQRAFYRRNGNKKAIDRLVGEGRSMENAYDVKALPGQSEVPVKYLVWADKLAIVASDDMGGETFEGMRRLEMSGNKEMVKFVRSSPLYAEYSAALAKENAKAKKTFVYKASAPYKSSITPNEWVENFNKDWKPGTTDRLLGFLKDVDTDRKILSELYKHGKFGSDEYKKVYYHLQDYITKARKSAPGLAEYIGATTPDLLAMGPNAVNKPHFVGPQAKAAQKAFEAVTPRILKGGWSAKELLAIKTENPVLAPNWDEAVSRWAWEYVLDASRQGRHALESTNNPYGWYKGWTIDSKYGKAMQSWLKSNIGLVRASGAATQWVDEWERADAASGGNLISDLLNLQR